MAIQKTEKVWHNGKFINWGDATIHVMSHVVHYGSSVFEGIRCYALPSGPAIFRAKEHMERLINSARIYRIEVPFTADEILSGMVELVGKNGVWPCYIRPVILRGYGEAGVNPFNSPTEVYICNYPWGKYLGADANQGVDVCVSSWTRIAPNTLPAIAKAGANYMNSQLIKMEAIVNGYAEGIALDVNGYVSEGSGENIFVVRCKRRRSAILFCLESRAIRSSRSPTISVSRSSSSKSRGNRCISPMRSSSPARLPKSRRSDRSTKLPSVRERSARSPNRFSRSFMGWFAARRRTCTTG